MIGLFFIVSFLRIGFAQETIRLATTTSVQDTGLLDLLINVFQKKTQYKVQTIAVGSGQAMQLGRTGEADILWVHSLDDEKQFMAEGYGVARITVMHNDFVILGPKNDPAQIKGIKKASDAFKKIAASKALFVSRGDNSGTHKKEKKLWETAEVIPDKEKYYIEVGQGMAAAITVANEKKSYCLADRATYLSLKKSVELVIICEGDVGLTNHYSLILVNPDKFPKVNSLGARELLNFLLSKKAKQIIENFGKEKYKEQLFFSDYPVK